ncbi:MAG: hypothetical protein RLZZ568_69 [Cyanobacteriota bacterium]|jgi:hypothetical protein
MIRAVMTPLSFQPSFVLPLCWKITFPKFSSGYNQTDFRGVKHPGVTLPVGLDRKKTIVDHHNCGGADLAGMQGLSREVCQEEIREENGQEIQWQSG